MRSVLILEDKPDRLEGFRKAVRSLGSEFVIREWSTATSMIAECEEHLENTVLISLDHDLVAEPSAGVDPGTGLHVALHLAGYLPVCPVVIHSSNTDASWSMHNELRFAGWQVERVGPIGDDWISGTWLPTARSLLSARSASVTLRRPADHIERMKRTLLSLEGLAIGDALGEMLSYRCGEAGRRIAERDLVGGPWFHTDDTEMALSIVEVLRLYGFLNQDALARRFAWRFQRDPDRGYGSMTRKQLYELQAGGKWQATAGAAFGGQGSMGNGGAMRVAPLGAYFADNIAQVAGESKASCVVTHTHPEGIAGAIAVAVAAAVAWQQRESSSSSRRRVFFDTVLTHTPPSNVREGIERAAQLPETFSAQDAARVLGNGSLVTSQDTVPFALWCAAKHLDNYPDALATAICGGGDCDTNAAIVGGIVSLAVGHNMLPAVWREARERFPFEKPQERDKRSKT
ncbi:MAG TPA: ADP-ribosylglycohydrolase family protein [Verrucomicrobiae bacterium]|nr:ADP-ribosylglycohydrolase family protein [Verrucomicrobiae bacterium]